MNDFLDILKTKDIGKVLIDEKISKYTTYKIGSIVKAIIFPKDTKNLIYILKLCQEHKIKKIVLGGGSNVLFSDKPFEGVIIKLDYLNQIKFKSNKVTAQAGASLIKTSLQACKKGFSGLEFATGIPGTIGGAVYMNAGAYQSDMGYVIDKVTVLTPDYKIIKMVNKELNFHYRTSFFKYNKNYIILDATIKLKKGKKEMIEELVNDRRKRRLESQPLEYPSAGSVFRNPELLSAGKLIQDLGLKGLIRGGAQISAKHANFIVNIGNAKGQDVKDLIDLIKQTVKENYNIDLFLEQELINWE